MMLYLALAVAVIAVSYAVYRLIVKASEAARIADDEQWLAELTASCTSEAPPPSTESTDTESATVPLEHLDELLSECTSSTYPAYNPDYEWTYTDDAEDDKPIFKKKAPKKAKKLVKKPVKKPSKKPAKKAKKPSKTSKK